MSAAPLAEFDYRLRGRAPGSRPGSHRGAHAGDGQEPFAHESLLDGRDPRRLDKLASARDPLRRLLLRRYRQRTAVPVCLLADVSASVAFRGAGDRLALLADFVAALGYSTARAGDALTILCCDDRVREDLYLPPTRVGAASLDVAERLRTLEPDGRDSSGLLEALARIGARRSLVFLASDFHFPLDLLGRVLDGLDRHEVVPVMLVDSAESRPPPALGIVRVSDLETGAERMLLMRPGLQRRFVEQAGRRRRLLDECFATRGIEPLRLVDRFHADQVTDYFHA